MKRDKKGRFVKGMKSPNKGISTVPRILNCRKCGGEISYSASYTSTSGLCRKCWLEDISANKPGRTPNTKCEVCGKPLYRRPWQFKVRKWFSCKACQPKAIKRHPEMYAAITSPDSGRFKRGRKMSPEQRLAISRRQTKRVANDPAFKRHLLRMNLRQCRARKPSRLETAVYQGLLSLGVPFIPQKLLKRRFIVDAYIPKARLAIEVDGEYWHSLEKTKRKDRAENAYLTKCGYKLVRVPERAVKDGTYLNLIGEALLA